MSDRCTDALALIGRHAHADSGSANQHAALLKAAFRNQVAGLFRNGRIVGRVIRRKTADILHFRALLLQKRFERVLHFDSCIVAADYKSPHIVSGSFLLQQCLDAVRHCGQDNAARGCPRVQHAARTFAETAGTSVFRNEIFRRIATRSSGRLHVRKRLRKRFAALCCRVQRLSLIHIFPVISVILNNRALGMVRQMQGTFYGGRYSCSEPDRKTDYQKVAEGFGAAGVRCETLSQLRTAFQNACKSHGPVWIECPISREARVLPMIPTNGTVDDIILK